MSDQNHDDTGTITALLERAERRIPNLLAMKENLESGGTLSDIEIEELARMVEQAQHQIPPVVARHPQYEELAARFSSLVEDVSRLALDNEPGGS